ncbi:MAG: lipase maturation factor family protein [Actinobacteria bacterium]|nr:lipase maturation factor family protein [Actinomycetota bacterium]
MRWATGADLWLSRWVFERFLAGTYLIAFVVVRNQFRPLLGEHGLLPVPQYLARTRFRRSPSLFHWRYSDRLVGVVAWLGIGVAAALLAGLPQAGPAGASMVAWLVLWALYLSVVNVGQTFYGFGWESLLLEVGFLAAFLGNAAMRPPVAVMWLLRWVLFRLEFGAGLIKLRGDPCWRDLTCLQYHHETQPMPNPLSWRFHRLPPWLHRIEVLANHVAQLVVPWLLFAPEPVATVAAVVVVVTQCWLVLSGNFSWLNLLTIALGLAAVDGSLLARLLPVDPPRAAGSGPAWHRALVVAVAVGVVVMSWWPVRNMALPGQVMNASFNRLHLVNTYGAFGSITRVRRELVIEGTAARALTGDVAWREYEHKGKPGDPRRRPPQVAPYHLRLDWLLWFVALSPAYGGRWFDALLAKLLEGDRATLRLLRYNPFPDAPPNFLRVRLYRYRFTTRPERKATGAWWERTLVGDLVPPVRRRSPPAAPRGSAGGA